MAETNIPLSGITTTSIYEQGDCASRVNLRKKNGVLKPVPPRKVITALTQKYNLIFVHQYDNYENWLGIIVSNGQSQVYNDIKGTPLLLTTLSDSIKSIQQIGNTISLMGAQSIYYMLYTDSTYNVLGEVPELPVLGFDTAETVNTYYFDQVYTDTGIVSGTHYHYLTINSPDDFLTYIKGVINYGINDIITNKEKYGALTDFYMLRYAFRLYDGTYLKQSAPILLLSQANILDARILKSGIVDNNKLYTSYAGNHDAQSSRVDVLSYKLNLSYSFDLTAWKDIIKSVDIFLSPSLGLVDPGKITKTFSTDQRDYREERVIETIVDASLTAVKEASTFYLIKQLSTDSAQNTGNTPYVFPSSTDDHTNLTSLTSNTLLTDDTFSHNKVAANVSYAYNKRLHIADLTTVLFKGFTADYFCRKNKYDGVVADIATVSYRYIIEVDLLINNMHYYCYAISDEVSALFLSSFISYPDTRAKSMTIYRTNTLTNPTQWYQVAKYTLTEHSFLTCAFYLNTATDTNGNTNFIPIQESTTPTTVTPPDTSVVPVIYDRNKLKVSTTDNPFYFSNSNVSLVGNWIIRNMATNAMQVSQGQFGQYPLYILTSDRLYALNIGSTTDVYYSTSAPLADVSPTSSVICATHRGVAFIGKRGIYLINGQDTVLLTGGIEQMPVPVRMQFPSGSSAILQYHLSDFNTYLSGIDQMVYDPINDDLIISNPEYDFNFIINLETMDVWQCTNKFDLSVQNIYPDVNVCKDLNLLDYLDSQTNMAHVSLITRPMNMKSTRRKQINRVILRGRLFSANPTAMLEVSNDGIYFEAIRGLQFTMGNLKDLDMGLMAENKFRQYVFALGADMVEYSEITQLDCDVIIDNESDKMR